MDWRRFRQLWDFLLLGDSILLDLNIGATGSADNVDMLWNVQGDTNIFDVDIGGNYAPDNPNMDLTILGDRNDFRSAVQSKHGVVLVPIGTILSFTKWYKVDVRSYLGNEHYW